MERTRSSNVRKEESGLNNKRRAVKKVEEEPSDDGEEEIVESIDAIAEEIIFGKNPTRSYILRDIWYDSLSEVVMEDIVPEENRREIMFLTLTNALLDMIMDIVPEDMAMSLARNLDDYLAVTMVNQQYDVDLLKNFQEEFVEVKGSDFDTEEKLMDALSEFEEEWWNTSREDLKGKSPNEALQEVTDKYDL